MTVWIHRVRNDIDSTLEAAVGQSAERSANLAAAMRYAVVGGGKRFRATLTIAAAEMVGGCYEQAVRIGAAIECVHAQSLIHDDLPCMDDDSLRRGKPTVHRQFDEATAVIAGDALLALAFEILADELTHPDATIRARLVLRLAQAVGQDGLAGGQMLDLYPPVNASQSDMEACESRKTGALIRYAVEAGAMLGQCSPEELSRLIQFAERLGLVFQIRDDVLDVIGDPEEVGKALGKDIASGRASATAVLGVENAILQSHRLERECLEALSGFGSNALALKDLTSFAVRRHH
jgi:geranylgeranyl pyrophosphate synthase